MKIQLFAVIACAAAACAAGPRTTPDEFFTKHLDTSIPALSSIPAKMAAGDLAGAENLANATFYLDGELQKPGTWIALYSSGLCTVKAHSGTMIVIK